jgi:hypothetical protein
MTTIYLILHYLGLSKYYTIDYQTREATQEFLEKQMDTLVNSIHNGDSWENFIQEPTLQNYNNVDIFHFHLIFTEIHKWFEKINEEEKNTFRIKLLEQVHIIWYDIKINAKNQQAEDVFLNLNAGKISLTSSELIKALFILDVQKRYSQEITKLKAAELAIEWDTIENKLQEDDFWYFICDNAYYNNQDTRIDFLIDLTNEIAPPKNDKNWDGMDSYRKYEKEFVNGESLDWSKIKQNFNKLNEWYSDKELYHYVGYLVVTGIKTLNNIVKESKGKNKEAFKNSLIEYIRAEFKKTKTDDNKTIHYYELDSLNYEDYRLACQNILLLLNVQYYLNNLSQNKFPFDLYKKESWSVEHINPQNPKEFKTIYAIIKWLESFSNYFKSEDIEVDVTQKINEVCLLLKSIENLDKNLSEIKWPKENLELLKTVIEMITEKLELHGISNLALLDKNTNSKLGNKIFMDKRKVILELYYKGKENKVFIPECTRDIFTKNYSKDAKDVSDEIFGLQNMEDYKSHLKIQLENYYKTESNGN